MGEELKGGNTPANSRGVGRNRGEGRRDETSRLRASIAKEVGHVRESRNGMPLLCTTQLTVRQAVAQ
jgi:hypothetical protein